MCDDRSIATFAKGELHKEECDLGLVPVEKAVFPSTFHGHCDDCSGDDDGGEKGRAAEV